MSEVLPFQKPDRQYEYSKEVYLLLIMMGLEHMYGRNNGAKVDFILAACPFLSIARVEQFYRKVSKATVEHYAKLRAEEAAGLDYDELQELEGERS